MTDREKIARIIDPYNWQEADSYRKRADEWFAKGWTEPGYALTDGYRAKADAIIQPSLAKAAAIAAMNPPIEADAVREAARAIVDAQMLHAKGGYYSGWSITALNKAIDPLRAALGMEPTPLDPETRRMMEHAKKGKEALALLRTEDGNA